LSFDNNQVTTLDALHKSVSLLLLSAENNLITDLSGISNSTKLKYICLSHNQIPDMSPIANLIPETYNDYSLIDLSSNHISEIKVSKE
jgi:internalin A